METEGPKYEEIMEIIHNMNENKATSGIIKPQIIKLGGTWCHEIIYRIIRQIWNERNQDNTPLLNESKVILLHKDGDKSIANNYRPISLRHMILNILDRWIQKS